MKLNKYQKEAILHKEGPCLVTSCPGSGKCVVGDTLVFSDDCLLSEIKDQRINKVIGLASENLSDISSGIHPISEFVDSGIQSTIRIKTKQGFEIEGTYNHPIVIINKTGDYEWKCLKDISKGDVCVIWGNKKCEEPIFDEKFYLIGLLYGNGCLNQRRTFSFHSEKNNISSLFCQYVYKYYGYICKVAKDTRRKNLYSYKVHSVPVMIQMKKEFGDIFHSSYDKYITPEIFNSSKDKVASFLRGIFDTDSNVTERTIDLTMGSKKLIDQIHVLLLHFGVFSTKRSKFVNGKEYFRIQIFGESYRRFIKSIGLNHVRKKEISRIDRIFRFHNYKNKDFLRIKDLSSYFYSEVTNIEYNENRNVFDYVVPNSHSFIANGFVNHNTLTLVERIVFLIQSGVKQKNILCLTFTNKAANEMKERVCSRLKTDSLDFFVGTFHALCSRLLRKLGHESGLKSNFSILDERDQIDLVMKVARNIEHEISWDDARNISHCLNYYRDQMEEFSWVEHELVNDIKIDIAKEYLAKCKKDSLIDFSGLIYETIKMIENNEKIKRKVQNTFKYIMVDETQDTNKSQFYLINILGGKYHNIMLIGDVDQCVIEGTKILTPDGEIDVQTIKESDYISVGGGEGTVEKAKVIGVYRQHVENYDVVTIKTLTGKKCTFSKEHVVFSGFTDNFPEQHIVKIKERRDFSITICAKQKSGLHRFYIHSSEERDKTIFKSMGFTITDRVDGRGFKISGSKNSLEEIYDIFSNINSHVKYNLIEKASLCGEPLPCIMAAQVKKGMMIFIEDRGRIIKDEVIEVQDGKYTGFLFDIQVDKYANFISNKIAVHNSIYGWRGARYQNIQDFIEKYDDCRVISLSKNYRSTPEIVKAAGSLIKYNSSHMETEFETDNQHGYAVQCVEMPDQFKEAEWVGKTIRRFVNEKGWEPDDIVVLYRVNKMSEPIEQSLANNGVPYEVIGSFNFYDRREIRDCLAMMKLLFNPHDGVSFHRICGFIPGIGDITVGKIEKIAEEKNISIVQACLEITSIVKSMNVIKGCQKINKIYSQKFDFSNPAQCLRTLIDNFQYKSFLLKKFDNDATEREENVEQLIDSATQFIGKDGISKYLQQVALVTNSDKEKDGNRVSLMSLHAAKGLEFPIVFMIGVEDGILPHKNALADDPCFGIEEERRLCYVGMTRSKNVLILSWCKYRKKFGKFGVIRKEKSKISPFIKEANIL